MFLPLIEKVAAKQGSSQLAIVLGSQSPRRQQLLKHNVLADRVDFISLPSSFAEDFDTSPFSPRELVEIYTSEKSKDVVIKLMDDINIQSSSDLEHVLLICGDTVIGMENQIIEKPRDEKEAIEMYKLYDDTTHKVITAIKVTLFEKKGGKLMEISSESFVTETTVKFTKFVQEEAEAYVKLGEFSDKAGGYAMQDAGAQFIEKIDGCYFNVMGFPVFGVSRAMAKVLGPILK